MTESERGAHAAIGEEDEPVVAGEHRRPEPDTAAVSEEIVDAQASEEPATESMEKEVGALRKQLDERTSDLQRMTAEYANYRKRIDRDREAVITGAKAQVITQLLPVLDDLERAAAHGDLTGPFKSVADKLFAAVEQAGLEPFGHEGEPFDPSVHEAVQHDTSPEVSGPTVTGVLRRGYKLGDRLARAALVAVTDAEAGSAQVPGDAPGTEHQS